MSEKKNSSSLYSLLLNFRNSWRFFITTISRYRLCFAYIPSALFSATQSSWTRLSTKLLKSFVPFSGIMYIISGSKLLAFRTTAYFKGDFHKITCQWFKKLQTISCKLINFTFGNFICFHFVSQYLIDTETNTTTLFLKWFLASLKLTSQRMLAFLRLILKVFCKKGSLET